jgi:hypothetical protein
MMSVTAVPSDTTWLHAPNYQVLPLNTTVAGRVPELKRALQSGLPACPDMNRHNFYDVELPGGWAYIHVRDDNRTVYLVAFSHA